MKPYNKIPFWENRKRIDKLEEFRQLFVDYFNIVYLRMNEYVENEEAKNIRSEINFIIDNAYSIIIASGINTNVYYTHSPASGGRREVIDLITNIFNLGMYDITPSQVLDIIDRSIGIYYHNINDSILRTINPFYWFGLVLDYFASLPFTLIGKMGYNQSEIETSSLGKTLKGVVYLVEVLVSILTLYIYRNVLFELISKI